MPTLLSLRREVGPAVVLAGAFLLCLALTWGRWGNVQWDVGTFLGVPAELARGKTLYRDMYSWYGPVGPYFYALILRWLGTGLATLYLTGVVVAGITVAAVYGLARVLLPPWQALVAGLYFLVWGAFGILSGNFFLAYSAAAPPAVLLGVLFLLALLHAVEETRLRLWWVAGVLLGLCLISKHEFAAAAGATAVVACLQARQWRPWVALWTPALVIPAAALAWFMSQVSWQVLFWENIWPVKQISYYRAEGRYYFFSALGPATLEYQLHHLPFEILFLAMVLAGAWLWSRSRPAALLAALLAAIVTLASPLRSLVWAVASGDRLFPTLFSPMVYAAPLTLLFLTRKIFDRRSAAPILVCTYASLMILRGAPGPPTGFWLVAPVIAALWLLLQVLPNALARRNREWARAYALLMTTVLAYGAGASFYNAYHSFYRDKNAAVTGPAGTFYDYPQRAAVFRQVLEEIERRPGETLVCGTEGSWVNFLMRRPVPLRHTQWWPFTEDGLLKDLAILSPPRIYVLNFAGVEELSFLRLHGLHRFLDAHYRRVKRIEPPEPPVAELRAVAADVYQRLEE